MNWLPRGRLLSVDAEKVQEDNENNEWNGDAKYETEYQSKWRSTFIVTEIPKFFYVVAKLELQRVQGIRTGKNTLQDKQITMIFTDFHKKLAKQSHTLKRESIAWDKVCDTKQI